MRTILTATTIALLIIFAFASEAIGAFIMVYDLYVGGPNFIKGFTMFSLGAILFLACITCFAVLKNLTISEGITEVIGSYFQHQIDKSKGSSLHNLLNNLAGAQVIQFQSEEEFLKHKDEILDRVYGTHSPDMKEKLENMSINELKAEEQKAVANQEFEKAALIVQFILQKQNS